MFISQDLLTQLIDGANAAHRATWLENREGILPFLDATGATPSKITGDLAQTSVTLNSTFTASTTTASTALVVTSGTPPTVGAVLTGAGIAAGTTASAVNGNNVTLSIAATATASGVTVTAAGEEQVLGLSEWTIDWKEKTVDASTTDDGPWDTSLPSTMSWTVKSKFMFIDSDGSQNAQIIAALTGSQNAKLWNFFPTIAVGRSGFTGLAYLDGVTIGTGRGKVVTLDVSLKGTGPLTPVTQLAPVATSTTTGLQAED